MMAKSIHSALPMVLALSGIQAAQADVLSSLTIGFYQACGREVKSTVSIAIDETEDWNLVNNQIFRIKEDGLAGITVASGGKGILAINTHPLPNNKWGASDTIVYSPYKYNLVYCAVSDDTYELVYETPTSIIIEELGDTACGTSPGSSGGSEDP